MIIDLIFRSALGVKQVLGRSSVGPYAFCSGLGLEQWQAGSSNSHQAIKFIYQLFKIKCTLINQLFKIQYNSKIQ